jgi:SAM-dependent methyltransferase
MAESVKQRHETSDADCCGSDCCAPDAAAAVAVPADIHAQVQARYAEAARVAAAGRNCGCDPDCCTHEAPDRFGAVLYDDAHRESLPDEAVIASLGCGNPTTVADLREGEVVLDLGSGGGIDVLLSARRVGATGKAYGLDMTEEMLALARANAAKAGATNVEFLRGQIEDIPLPAGAVDVVISNCVVNLSPDKAAVLRETHRVLVPGGRTGTSHVAAEVHLTAADRRERGTWVGCIAGALSCGEYLRLLDEAGFEDTSVEFTHEVAPGLHGAIVRAIKPLAPAG